MAAGSTHATEKRASEISLETKVAYLKCPESYPDNPHEVEAVETHMSWVFLTRRFAYKLKKPVRREFLDFSTLEARQRDCEAEIRLNRRLAPRVYIASVPLGLDCHGALHLEGPGVVADWLVKMHRLPETAMLDYVIRHDTLRADDVRPAARLLAEFYRTSATVRLTSAEYRARLERDIAGNEGVLSAAEISAPAGLADEIASTQRRFLSVYSELFDRRVAAGHIIEAHGDLRPAHVYLGPEPAVIDCAEFNREFRILDPADELAFLSLECERLGSEIAGRLFFDVYRQITKDSPPPELVDFYKSCRAYLRAKLAVWHIEDPGSQDACHWISLAREYLHVARAYMADS